jgi:hypothetical protein
METRFLLRLAQALIDWAKKIAHPDGNLARSRFLRVPLQVDSEEPPSGSQLTPQVRFMIGSLKGASTTEADYLRYLEAKYR